MGADNLEIGGDAYGQSQPYADGRQMGEDFSPAAQITAESKRRPTLGRFSICAGRDSVDLTDRSPLEGLTAEISFCFDLLEAAEALGRRGGVASHLESLSVYSG